ncbi:hypothetical protein Tco_0673845 [Tanacetum coccineum]
MSGVFPVFWSSLILFLVFPPFLYPPTCFTLLPPLVLSLYHSFPFHGNGGNGNGRNENPDENGRGDRPVARECTYQDFMKCQPLNFKGTEGVVGLIRWFEKTEIVFHCRLVPSCFVIYDLELLSLSFDFVFSFEIFKSLSFHLDCLCRLAILCLDQHAHTLHHLETC